MGLFDILVYIWEEALKEIWYYTKPWLYRFYRRYFVRRPPNDRVPDGAPVVDPEAVPVPVVDPEAVPVPVVDPEAVPVPVVDPEAVPVPVVDPEAVPVPEEEPLVYDPDHIDIDYGFWGKVLLMTFGSYAIYGCALPWLLTHRLVNIGVVYSFSLFFELVLGLAQPWTLLLTFALRVGLVCSSVEGKAFTLRTFVCTFLFLLVRALL